MATFLVHRHSTGRGHFDIRIVEEKLVRSWSLLKEPPLRPGDRRLAIEREPLTIDQISRPVIEEEAFGSGRARLWDSGNVCIVDDGSKRMVLEFAGGKMSGRYELRRMKWYPGNRWMLEKSAGSDANLT